ncbi:MAG: addiction module protein [Pyrinomonadaceae bacterium]
MSILVITLACMNSQLVNDARELPLAEQIELIDALWESIVKQGYQPPLTPEQSVELDRRLVAHRRNPDDVFSWDSIKREILDKYSHR